MSRRIFIPTLDTTFVLDQDWHFDLYNEERNVTLMALLGDTRTITYDTRQIQPLQVCLPQGSILKVDRIYIRRGQDGFDSLSFVLIGQRATVPVQYSQYLGQPKTVKRAVRFWAKLNDVNKMVVADTPNLS